MPAREKPPGRTLLAVLAGALALLSGCATPVGVTHVDHTAVYRSLTRSALSGPRPSTFTEAFLLQHGLENRFEEEPAVVIAEVRGDGKNLAPDVLFALAELCFLNGEAAHDSQYHLAAAVYALAFIASPEWRAAGLTANAIDPRTRLAADFYNLGLVNGLRAPAPTDGQTTAPPEVILTDRVLRLPFGELELNADEATFLWGGYRFERFIATSDYQVRGLRNRYRQPGMGAPLLAEVTPVTVGPDGDAARRRIPPTVKVPVTAILRIKSVGEQMATGHLRGTLEVHAADAESTFEVNGAKIPLELDPTAALAYMLEGAPVWDSELAGFLKASRPVFGDGLILLAPYRRGRVPVVLVHGTASSPARWAEIINDVQNDPALRERVQIWLFTYNTSNPILYSASLLRQALQNAIRDFDPSGTDPALRRMVIMGHSQGGLLTRLMVTDSGTRFWDNAANVPLDQIEATPEQRDLLRAAFFFEPQPYVTEVVFLATPHRGSYRVTSLVLNLVRKLVTLPIRVTQALADLGKRNPGAFTASAATGSVTAVDNMNPSNPFIKTLSESPIAPGVSAHSIIAVEGTGPLSGRSDGVVRFESAHLDGVASEKVVQSSHSMQANPDAILEIRRILREHLEGH